MQTNRQGGTGEVPYQGGGPMRRLYLCCVLRLSHLYCVQTNRQGGTGEVPYKVEDPVRRLYPAFTRRREHFIGRTAMLGVAACWAGEVSKR